MVRHDHIRVNKPKPSINPYAPQNSMNRIVSDIRNTPLGADRNEVDFDISGRPDTRVPPVLTLRKEDIIQLFLVHADVSQKTTRCC
jgi:hypothetical protein